MGSTCVFNNIIFCFRAFDVELLYIAQFFKIPIAEIAVNWTEIEGESIVHFTLLFTGHRRKCHGSAVVAVSPGLPRAF